ncbi:hypothetical protein WN51_02073 [Melipona quadrifasciata]|uniref:Uncharacterized protein n=1 Tax=Melipona quadrifasciata TaxID=166423 RepID=A0A0M9A007_9HYME|nr:hypothetical protein WN51_02073 [Melipona quadrifasciata]
MAVLFVNKVKIAYTMLTVIIFYVPNYANCAALTTEEFAKELEKLARETNLDDREVYRTENLEDQSVSCSYDEGGPCMEWNPYDSGTRMVVVFTPKLRLCGCPADMYEDVHEKTSKTEQTIETEETCEARENESMNCRQSTTAYDIEREMFDDMEYSEQERRTYPSKIYTRQFR